MSAHPNPQYGRARKTGHTVRAYLGTCLLCGFGCFQGDDVTRGRGRLLGLLHTSCAKGAESHAEPRSGAVDPSGHDDRQETAQ
jgi:hypothetical protein